MSDALKKLLQSQIEILKRQIEQQGVLVDDLLARIAEITDD